PKNIAKRAQLYPRTSASGGAIGKNSVGPQGLEIASFPNTVQGRYIVGAFDLVDATGPAPARQNETIVPYTVQVYVDGKLKSTVNNRVGFLNQSYDFVTVNQQQVALQHGSTGDGTRSRTPGILPSSALPARMK